MLGWFFMEQVPKTVERAEGGVAAESSFSGALGGLCRSGWLVTFVSCVRDTICVYGEHLRDGDVLAVCVRPEYITRRLCRSLNDYD